MGIVLVELGMQVLFSLEQSCSLEDVSGAILQFGRCVWSNLAVWKMCLEQSCSLEDVSGAILQVGRCVCGRTT